MRRAWQTLQTDAATRMASSPVKNGSAQAAYDAGFSTPDDLSSNFLGKLNRVYGAQGKVAPDGTYQGGVGYIIE